MFFKLYIILIRKTFHIPGGNPPPLRRYFWTSLKKDLISSFNYKERKYKSLGLDSGSYLGELWSCDPLKKLLKLKDGEPCGFGDVAEQLLQHSGCQLCESTYVGAA